MIGKGKSLRIELWGVRGSLPTPTTPEAAKNNIQNILKSAVKEKVKSPDQAKAFIKNLPSWKLYGFGGNTSCVEVESQTSHLIIDGGSGIHGLAQKMLKNRDRKEFHIVMTHFHWDHLIGLPFFTPLFIPGYTVHFYAVQPELEQVVRSVFKRPYFPVPFEELKSKIHFHKLEARKPHTFGDMKLTPYLLDHPDPCFGFKIECGGKTYSHVVDTEATRTSQEEMGQDLPLYQGVDLMLFDAQYTLKETTEKVHWGHSSAIMGLEIALRENIKKIIFVHHDPASSDEHIVECQNEAQAALNSSIRLLKLEGRKPPKIDWTFGREGLVFYL
jgi:phosphoribosyl 1,2-cyclic phosphodiesterase